jgi:uncharacterized membrane protein
MIIVLVSFLGFCVENTFICAHSGFIDNRNMILPFIFGYGLSLFGIYKLFGTPQEPLFFTSNVYFYDDKISIIYYFTVAFFAVSVGELIVGSVTEKLFGIIWWDYTRIPLHLTRYTSVPTSLAFATLITLFMRYCFDPILKAFLKLDPRALTFIAIAFVIILSADAINSTVYMAKHHKLMSLWRLDLGSHFKNAFGKLKYLYR